MLLCLGWVCFAWRLCSYNIKPENSLNYYSNYYKAYKLLHMYVYL